MGKPIELGKARIFPDVHLPNPVVLASYQGFHEILQYFNLAEERIRYLESLLDEKGISYGARTNQAVLPEPPTATT